MTLSAILTFCLSWAFWVLKFWFFGGWSLVRAVLGLLAPAWGLAALLGIAWAFLASQAQAGWFWGPDPKVEAANQALQKAAQIATEAAKTQSSQQSQLLAAIEALSSERTQLAGQLGRLGEMATRDSAWAAALQAFGPVLIIVAVLAVGCAAIWLVTRSGPQDAQLAAVLVDELSGTGSGVLSGPMHREALEADTGDHTASLGYEDAISDSSTQEGFF